MTMAPNPRPGPDDSFPSPTSLVQAETDATLLKHIPDQPLAKLDRNAHVQFLARNFVQGFPVRYTSQDASQPWLMFWTLQSFSLLQVGLDPGNNQRAIDTILTWQHPDGGFGGGPGQSPHLLATYASVCSLSIAGRPGENGGWDQIEREKMYTFFLSLKQQDGSFLVAHHAEVDVRPPLGEAHGGYTFCSLAAWVMLQPFLDDSLVGTTRPQINTNSLLRWLVHMQGSPTELGGFRGRTNKLVDGCYSWWVGGAFTLLEVLGVSVATPDIDQSHGQGDEQDWNDVDDSFFNREALQEYILYAGQHPAGGLRDKPPKNADAYHTMYCLSGLSSAQHRVVPSPERRGQILSAWQRKDDGTFHAFATIEYLTRT
ncbi:CAAX farnesyltransferase (FTase) subunit beta [Pleurotus pulmonarius]|nr:CAAX farnesyltransferase (FTase) subunit beta [Pleurotus pulmonarius]